MSGVDKFFVILMILVVMTHALINTFSIMTLQTQISTTDWREAARILEDCDGNVTIKQKYVDGVLTWFLDDSECEK